ncbi:RNA-directed DNA polymerase from mobile element jockey-like, partial [Brachionus plicatilis]
MEIGQVPKSWKIASITMIPKKSFPTQDPNNYCPISMTSCLGKLLERIIYTRIYNFLENNKLLIHEQSGFGKHRRTADNLYFLIQKVVESFNRKKKVCCLYFDISKAFDRVWHDGLIFKLIKINLPPYLIHWIRSFLHLRSFRVKVNGHLSDQYPIKAGVPQGSVISPLLFSIFINDIPKRNKTNCQYSLLFEDDLATFFIFKKIGNLEKMINKYLKEVEIWLFKWKMKISTENNLNNEEKVKFLGITLDSKLTFGPMADEMKERCNSRLNIIKYLSNRKWGLKPKTLGNLYKSLIGSILDYSFPCLNSFSETNIKKIQVIQNSAVRSILKLKYDTPLNIMHQEAFNKLKLLTVTNRLFELCERYVRAGLSHSVPLVVSLVEEYREGFELRYIEYPTPL